jgi:hypothetical protein
VTGCFIPFVEMRGTLGNEHKARARASVLGALSRGLQVRLEDGSVHPVTVQVSRQEDGPEGTRAGSGHLLACLLEECCAPPPRLRCHVGLGRVGNGAGRVLSCPASGRAVLWCQMVPSCAAMSDCDLLPCQVMVPHHVSLRCAAIPRCTMLPAAPQPVLPRAACPHQQMGDFAHPMHWPSYDSTTYDIQHAYGIHRAYIRHTCDISAPTPVQRATATLGRVGASTAVNSPRLAGVCTRHVLAQSTASVLNHLYMHVTNPAKSVS